MKKGILIIIMILLVGAAFAQKMEIDNYLENVIKARNIPGISVCVIQNKKSIYKGSFGFSNLETESTVTTQSVFQLASLTKPFTALAIMQLVEDEKIELTNSITNYIDSLPEKYKPITVENLLTHTAGFPDQVNLVCEKSAAMNVSTERQLEIILNEPLLFSAGEKGSYADPGYFLLGMIIERASAMGYSEYMRTNFFQPLGMKTSSIEDKWKIIKKRVESYRFISRTDKEIINGRRDYQHELPSHYGILSTLDDLSKWSIALRNIEIVSVESLQKMWNPTILNNGNNSMLWGSNYGYGWFLDDVRGEKYAAHGGFTGTHYLHFIDRDLSVIVLTNLDNFSGSDSKSIAEHIAGIVSQDLRKPNSEGKFETNENKTVTKNIRTVYSDINKASSKKTMAPQLVSFFNELPAPIKQRYLGDFEIIREITYLGTDDVKSKGLKKSGEDIVSICHYILKSDKSKTTYSFYITNDNRIAWIKKWKK